MSDYLPRPKIRAQTLRTLETLAERYPNLRIGQIIDNAISGKTLFYLDDDQLGYALNHLFVTLTQLEAAGIQARSKSQQRRFEAQKANGS